MGMEVMIVAVAVVMAVGVIVRVVVFVWMVAVRMILAVIVGRRYLKRIRHPHPALSHRKLWERVKSGISYERIWERN